MSWRRWWGGRHAGMDGDDEMMLTPAFGLLVVVLRHERGHGLHEFAGEGGAIGGGCEPYPAVHRERREFFLRPGGPSDQVTDIADQLRGQGQQPAGRQTVGCAGRIGGHGRQRRRRDHVGGRRGPEQPLGYVPLATLLHQLYQPVSLQHPQVVVDLLPRQADGGGEHGRRPRLGQLSQQARSGRLQRGLGGGRIGDHCYIDHETSLTSDKSFCQEKFICRMKAASERSASNRDRGPLLPLSGLSHISFSLRSGPVWGRGRAPQSPRPGGIDGTSVPLSRQQCSIDAVAVAGAGAGPALRAGVPWRARLMRHARDRAESRPGKAPPE